MTSLRQNMDPEALAAEVAMLQQPSSPSLPFELPPSPPIDAMEWARASDESCTDDQPMLSVKHSSLDALLDACQPFDPSPFDPSPLSKPRSTGNLTSLVPTEPQTSGTVYGSISSSENDADAAPSPSAPQSSSVIFVLVISLCWTVLGLHQGFPLLGFEYWEKLVLKLNPAGAAMINAIMLLPWFALPLAVWKSPEWFASLLGEHPVQRLAIVLGLAAVPSAVLTSSVALQLLPYCVLRLAAETFIVAAVMIAAHIVFNRARGGFGLNGSVAVWGSWLGWHLAVLVAGVAGSLVSRYGRVLLVVPASALLLAAVLLQHPLCSFERRRVAPPSPSSPGFDPAPASIGWKVGFFLFLLTAMPDMKNVDFYLYTAELQMTPDQIAGCNAWHAGTTILAAVVAWTYCGTGSVHAQLGWSIVFLQLIQSSQLLLYSDRIAQFGIPMWFAVLLNASVVAVSQQTLPLLVVRCTVARRNSWLCSADAATVCASVLALCSLGGIVRNLMAAGLYSIAGISSTHFHHCHTVRVVTMFFKLVPVFALWLIPESNWIRDSEGAEFEMMAAPSGQELAKRNEMKRKYLLRGVLESLCVEDILNPLSVISVNADDKIKGAWQKMLDNNVNAAPVWDHKKGIYVGFLELQDAVSYVVRLAEAEHRSRGECLKTLANAAMEEFATTPTHGSAVRERRASFLNLNVQLDNLRDTHVALQSPELYNALSLSPEKAYTPHRRGSLDELDTPLARQRRSSLNGTPSSKVRLTSPKSSTAADDIRMTVAEGFLTAPRSTIDFFARIHEFNPVKPEDCLREVALRLITERRVPVVNKHGRLVSVISQSRLTQFLNVEQHFWEWQLGHQVLGGTVEQFGFEPHPVFKVRARHTALYVFTKMRDKNIFSLPVIDDDGKLIACAQGRDLVGFLKNPAKFSLQQPILEFLELSHSCSKSHKDRIATITFQDEFTDVWDLMAEHGTQYVYIVDVERRPIGVISIGDAVRALICSEEGESTFIPEDIDVAFHNEEIERKAMQLCSVRMTRWPLNDKPPEFHEDELLTRPHMKYIWAHLPRKAVHHDWRLLFSLEQHGASLKSLYQRCKMVGNKEPCVTIIQTSKGCQLGCFTSQPWAIQKSFYGTGESYLFCFREHKGGSTFYEEFNTYHWDTSQPQHFQFSDQDSCSIGTCAEGVGLSFDERLMYGRTTDCPIFGSEMLTTKQEFKIVKMEVWGLGWKDLKVPQTESIFGPKDDTPIDLADLAPQSCPPRVRSDDTYDKRHGQMFLNEKEI